MAGCDHQAIAQNSQGLWVCPRCKADYKSDPFDRYFTSEETAGLMVDLAVECGLQIGHRVLEPSAGRGALVRALPLGVTVTAVELVRTEAAQIRLREGADQMALEVHVADFLRWQPPELAEGPRPFDLGLMNPPYSATDGADGLHVARALRWCTSVIALVRTNFLHGFGRYHQVFRWTELTHLIVLSRRPSFDGPADSGMGARHEYSIIRLKRRATERQPYQGDTPIVRFIP